MVCSELGGTVGTGVDRDDVPVVEHVVQTSEIGHKGVLGSRILCDGNGSSYFRRAALHL